MISVNSHVYTGIMTSNTFHQCAWYTSHTHSVTTYRKGSLYKEKSGREGQEWGGQGASVEGFMVSWMFCELHMTA